MHIADGMCGFAALFVGALAGSNTGSNDVLAEDRMTLPGDTEHVVQAWQPLKEGVNYSPDFGHDYEDLLSIPDTPPGSRPGSAYSGLASGAGSGYGDISDALPAPAGSAAWDADCDEYGADDDYPELVGKTSDTISVVPTFKPAPGMRDRLVPKSRMSPSTTVSPRTSKRNRKKAGMEIADKIVCLEEMATSPGVGFGKLEARLSSLLPHVPVPMLRSFHSNTLGLVSIPEQAHRFLLDRAVAPEGDKENRRRGMKLDHKFMVTWTEFCIEPLLKNPEEADDIVKPARSGDGMRPRVRLAGGQLRKYLLAEADTLRRSLSLSQSTPSPNPPPSTKKRGSAVVAADTDAEDEVDTRTKRRS